jgi:hypothetical protein
MKRGGCLWLGEVAHAALLDDGGEVPALAEGHDDAELSRAARGGGVVGGRAGAVGGGRGCLRRAMRACGGERLVGEDLSVLVDEAVLVADDSWRGGGDDRLGLTSPRGHWRRLGLP